MSGCLDIGLCSCGFGCCDICCLNVWIFGYLFVLDILVGLDSWVFGRWDIWLFGYLDISIFGYLDI